MILSILSKHWLNSLRDIGIQIPSMNDVDEIVSGVYVYDSIILNYYRDEKIAVIEIIDRGRPIVVYPFRCSEKDWNKIISKINDLYIIVDKRSMDKDIYRIDELIADILMN